MNILRTLVLRLLNSIHLKSIGKRKMKSEVLSSCILLNFLYQLTFLVGGGITFLLVPIFSAQAAEEAVCAEVKIEIQQELTLERQAFDAMMRINNNLDSISIADLYISVSFKDDQGNTVEASSDPSSTTASTTAQFFITVDRYTGVDGDVVSGADISAGSVLPATTAEIHWLIIPAPDTGGTLADGKLYFVGASLDYTIGGEAEHVDVIPDFITVKPLPLLTLDYFMTKEVIADDAFTPYVEPSVPFTLGVRVQNNGAAVAQSVSIDSAQPSIIENEQDLLINFNIIGSTVHGSYQTPSLHMNLGDVDPNEARVGRWQMITSLSGEFVDFSAEFSHADELGGSLTSIINATNAHFLIRDVTVDLPGRDLVRDFLALDGTTLRVYESDNVDTLVTDHSGDPGSTISDSSPGPGPNEVAHTVTVPAGAGLGYAKFSDTYAGSRFIKSVIRSDGKVMSLDNIWFSKTRNTTTTPPSWDHWLNVFDANSTGSYTLLMGLQAGGLPPYFDSIAEQIVYEENLVTVNVTATDPEGVTPVLTATDVPSGATFTDNLNGTGTLDWTPDVSTAGIYNLIFTASDGNLSTDSFAVVKVISETSDIDGDGMADGWEMTYFGSLVRDGTADFDGDGVSDLQEFLDSTNPNAITPDAPTALAATTSEGGITVSWSAPLFYDSINLYWSTSPDVTKTTSTKITGVASPYDHTGLDAGTTYYYVVTTVTAIDESAVSAEVSASTRIERAWETATVISSTATNLGEAFESEIAVANNGNATAIWTQCVASDCLWASHYTPATGWSAPEAVATGNTVMPRIVQEEDGSAMVIWLVEDGAGSKKEIWARRYDSTRGWQTATMLQDATLFTGGHYDFAVAPDVVIKPDGSVIVAWVLGEDPDTEKVYTGRYVAGSGWEAAVYYGSGFHPRQAVDALGNSTLAFTRDNLGNPGTYKICGTNWTYDSAGLTYSGSQLCPSLELSYLNMSDPHEFVKSSDNLGKIIWKDFVPESTDTLRYITMKFNGAGWTGKDDVSGPTTGLGTNIGGIVTDGAGNFLYPVIDPAGTAGGNINYFTYGVHWWKNWGLNAQISSFDIKAYTTSTVMDSASDASVVQLIEGGGMFASRYRLETDGSRNLVEEYISNYIDSGVGVEGVALRIDGAGNIWTVGRRGDGQVQVSQYRSFGSPPTSISSGPAVADEGAVVVLDGSVSTDAHSDIVSYEWIQVRGPAAVLTGENTATLSFTAPLVYTAQEQNLTFVLVTTDADGALGSSIHEIFINAVKPGGLSPIVDPIADQIVFEESLLSFNVTATDPEGLIPTLVATQLPTGSSFVDNADGSGTLSWTPSTATAGIYTGAFAASDGNLITNASVTIKVISATSDIDGDGVSDGWEMTHFGTLDRDGTGDLDGDGFSDMQEFLDGTNPNAVTPVAPTGLSGVPEGSTNTLIWQPVTGATSYNLYWSTSPGVSKATGTLLSGVTSPYVHTGLYSGTTYYYVVTTVSATDESAVSTEASASTPIERAWEVPTVISTSATELSADFESEVAVANNGDSIAVWTQCVASDCLWASHYDSGTNIWSAPEAVATGNVAMPRVKLGEDGSAMVIWLIEDGAGSKKQIWARRYDGISGWEAPTMLQDATLFTGGHYDFAVAPDVVLKPDGGVIVAWVLGENPDTEKVYTGRYVAGTGWESAVYYRSGYHPRQEVDALGNATLAFAKDNLGNPGTYQICGISWAYDSAATTYSSSQYCPALEVSYLNMSDPHEFVKGANNLGKIVWKDFVSGSTDTLRYITMAFNGLGWTGKDDVSGPTTGLGTNIGEIVTNGAGNYLYPVIDPAGAGGGNVNYFTNGVHWWKSWGLNAQISSLEIKPYTTSTVMDSASDASVVQLTQGGTMWASRYKLQGDGSRDLKEEYISNYIDNGVGVEGVALGIDGSGTIWTVGRREDGQVQVSGYKSFGTTPKSVISGPALANEGSIVVLDGSGSTDMGGDIVSYEWIQVQGPVAAMTGANTATLNFTVPAYDINNGSVVFVLVTVDSDGAMGSALHEVGVFSATSDIDIDGMADGWEFSYFSSLNRDGTGDFDGDGITDLQEFIDGTNPTAVTPGAPTGVAVSLSGGEATVTWLPVTGATSYNLYWSNSAGVTKSGATQVLSVTSPHVHAGLLSGTTYYYAITAVNATDESAVSTEVSVTTPVDYAWGIPTQLTSVATNLSEDFESQIDVANNGNAIAVWIQCIVADCLWVSHYTPSGGWTAPQSIATGNVSAPRVKLGEDGNAVVVWMIKDGTGSKKEIWGRGYVSGAWGSSQMLQDATVFNNGHYDISTGPDLVLRTDGVAVVAWNLWEDPNSFKIYFSKYDTATGWSAATYFAAGYTPRQQASSNISVMVYYQYYTGTTPATYRILVYKWVPASNGYTDYDGGAAINLRHFDANDPPEFSMNDNDQGLLLFKDYTDETETSFIYKANYYSGASFGGAPYNAYTNGDLLSNMIGVGIGNTQNMAGAISEPLTSSGGVLGHRAIVFPWSYDWAVMSGLSLLQVQDYSSEMVMDSVQNVIVAHITEGPGMWTRRFVLRPDGYRDIEDDYVSDYRDGENGLNGLAIDRDGSNNLFTVGRRADGHVYVSQFRSYQAAPKSVITGPASANESTAVVLDGSGSADAVNDIISHEWKQVRGPVVTLTGTNTDTLSFNMPVYDAGNASMVFILITVDAVGATGSAIHEVTVVDVP